MNKFGGKTDEYHFGHIKSKEVMEQPEGIGENELDSQQRFLVLGYEVRHLSCVNYR